MRIRLKFSDGLRARPGARNCIIATAAERQWGGAWTVTPKAVEHVSAQGRTMRWRPSLSALVTMFLFDLGLPVPVRSVRLIRGKTVQSRRVRKARRVATGAVAGGVLVLVVSGLAWVILVALGAVITVLLALSIVRLRSAPLQPAVRHRLPPWRLQELGPSHAGLPQPEAAPEPPRPSFIAAPQAVHDPELVQPAAPKATSVITEPAADVVPASQEVANAST